MGFSPRDPVRSGVNELPRKLWPIKHGTHVVAIVRGGDIEVGKVQWYFPARPIDASYISSPNCPLYGIVLKTGAYEIASASEVYPDTQEGYLALRWILYEQSRQALKDAQARVKRLAAGIQQEHAEIEEHAKRTVGPITVPIHEAALKWLLTRPPRRLKCKPARMTELP